MMNYEEPIMDIFYIDGQVVVLISGDDTQTGEDDPWG